MHDHDSALAAPTPPATPPPPAAAPAAPLPRALAWAGVVTVIAFAPVLWAWARFAWSSDLHSYTVLIPAISGYMLASGGHLPSGASPRRALWALPLLLAAVIGLGFFLGAFGAVDHPLIAAGTAAFVAALWANAGWFAPRATLHRLAFPLGFLAFMVPLPPAALHAIETAMQHGSAAVAHAGFELAGTPVFYTQLTFQLPGVALLVAPECSGIRSTLVLLVVGVVAGYFFLRSPGARLALALAVVPLALLRNGFRIFVIGELCVRYGPAWIESWIHRRGGPVFFALSLVPLLLLLVLLQRRERRRPSA